MSRRKKRLIYFVCSSIVNDELISETIAADSALEATELFFTQYQIKAKIVHGPFYKKKVEQVIVSTSFKVTNQIKKAHYGSWLVNAVILKEPLDSALLIFIQRLDDKKVPPPKGPVIIPITDLRFLNE